MTILSTGPPSIGFDVDRRSESVTAVAALPTAASCWQPAATSASRTSASRRRPRRLTVRTVVGKYRVFPQPAKRRPYDARAAQPRSCEGADCSARGLGRLLYRDVKPSEDDHARGQGERDSPRPPEGARLPFSAFVQPVGPGAWRNEYAVTRLRVRGVERVSLHADLVVLARLSLAVARARSVPLAA